MENKVIFIDITPDNSAEYTENAGVMWEHNATVLKFNIDTAFVGDYRYYIEYRSLMGTKVRTEYLELNKSDNTVTYAIPVTMSSLKGIECYFNIVSLDGDGNTVQVIKPKKFCLSFDYSPDTDNELCKVNDFSINSLLEAIHLGTYKGDKGEKGDKGDKGDKGETGGISEEYAAQNFANAYKGVQSGASISLDDTSPVEHEIAVFVHSKNYFDALKLTVGSSNGGAYISQVSEDYFVVTTPSGYTSNGMVNTKLTLKELCPFLQSGKTYIISGETDSEEMKCIYLYGNSGSIKWGFNSTKIMTEDLLNSIVLVYGFNNASSSPLPEGTGDCKISNLQIEEGDTVTEYTTYIAPDSVTITIGADNYKPSADGTVSGVRSMTEMSFVSDTDGVIITVEYNKDLNKIIDRLTNAIISLGGSV